MSQAKSKMRTAGRRPDIAKWQERARIERRADRDKRTRNSNTYFVNGGKERRSGKERRDRWIRVGKWHSESVFDE